MWRVLTDFDAFPKWNPFVLQASGEAAAGSRLRVSIQSPGSRGMTFRPTVLVSASTVEPLESNAASGTVTLSDEQKRCVRQVLEP